MREIAIVGAGAAGLTAAETLRSNGFDGTVHLIGAEKHLPYDRPPLSKQLLLGTVTPERTALRTPESYADLALEPVLGRTATHLDLSQRRVVLDHGRSITFDGLIIATGVQPRALPVDHSRNVCYLRTLEDALTLRERLSASPRTVIIGAGFLGLEVASAARQLGCEVTVIDALPLPMLHQLGPLFGRLLRDLHEDLGVTFHLGAQVRSVDASSVCLDDGVDVSADLVVAAVGTKPNVDWLCGSGLRLDDGVRCDAWCKVMDGVYVAGDLASVPDPATGTRQRFEHRTNAAEQGRCAALNVLGHATRFTPSRCFWTDQAGVRIQAAGAFPQNATWDIVDGNVTDRRFVATCTADDVLTGVVGWALPRSFTQFRRRIGERVGSPLP